MDVNFLVIFKISIVLLFLDFIYMQFIYKKFNDMIFNIQNSNIELNVTGAILCYICIIFMLYYFIIKDNKSLLDAFILGFTSYGIYEFTSMSLLKNWNFNVALTDTIWGGTLYALTTFIIKNNYI